MYLDFCFSTVETEALCASLPVSGSVRVDLGFFGSTFFSAISARHSKSPS
jgi:hypothetical protein